MPLVPVTKDPAGKFKDSQTKGTVHHPGKGMNGVERIRGLVASAVRKQRKTQADVQLTFSTVLDLDLRP